MRNSREWSLALVSTVLLLAFVMPAVAQPAGEGAVTGTGVGTVKKTPDILRVQFDLAADGKDIKDAMTKLQAKKEALKAKLAKLGAVESATEFGDTQMGAAVSDRRREIERALRSRMARGRGGPASQPAAAGMQVSVNVKAEWALAGKSGDDLLLAAHELHEKIVAADISDAKSAPSLLAGLDDEAREEAEAMLSGSGEAAAPPVMFVFVSKLTAAEREKATADAFAKARDNAGQLAKAAGMQLGVLKQLSARDVPDQSQMMNDYDPSYAYRYRQRMMEQYMSEGGAAPSEAVGQQPGAVKLQIAVSASFSLK